MKEFIDAYQTHLMDKGKTDDLSTPWEEFLFFALEFSIPHIYSSSASLTNLQKGSSIEENSPLHLEDGLLFQYFCDHLLPREEEAEEATLSLPVHLFEQVQEEIQKIKKSY